MAESLISLRGDNMDDDDWPIPEQSKSIKALFARAKESFVSKDYDNALWWYSMIADQTADGPADNVIALIKSLYMISRCHMEKGFYDEALSIVNNVCDLVVSYCPENIHIPEKFIIKIWERRGNILAAFLLAIIFKELRQTNPEADSVLSDIQSKMERFTLTKEASFVNRTVFDALLLKGRTFYYMNNPFVAAAFFSKAIEMFQYVFPGDSLQEALDWHNACLVWMQEHQMSYRQYEDQTNSTKHEEKSTMERFVKDQPSPERYLSNQWQSMPRNTEPPEKVDKGANLKLEDVQDSASGMAHTAQSSSSRSSINTSSNNNMSRSENNRSSSNNNNRKRRNRRRNRNNNSNTSSNNNTSRNTNSSINTMEGRNSNISNSNNNISTSSNNTSSTSSNNTSSTNISTSSNNTSSTSSNNTSSTSSTNTSSTNTNTSSTNTSRNSNSNISTNTSTNTSSSTTPSTNEGFEDSENMMRVIQSGPVPVKEVKHHELKVKKSIQGVELFSDPENPHVQLMITKEDNDNYIHTWTFCTRFKVEQVDTIPSVYLQYHRQHFYISSIQADGFDKGSNKLSLIPTTPMKTDHYHRPSIPLDSNTEEIEFRVEVTFQASSFLTGSFIQRILFDFGKEALLIKEFNIDVGSSEILDKLLEARQEVGLELRPWDHRDAEIIKCKPHRAKEKLMSTYSLPENTENVVSVQMVEGTIRQDTYKQTMHQLLFAEEVCMRNLLLRLTPTKLKLRTVKCLDLGVGHKRYAARGHFFGSIDLDGIEITPDDVAGRVCLRNVRSVLIMPNDQTKCLYEAVIEHLQSTKVIVSLTPEICNELQIEEGSIVDVCIRFNLNRVPHCVMHKAIDSLGPEHVLQLFPDNKSLADKKERKKKGIFRSLDPRLNECQKRVIQAIAKVVPPTPPLVVLGPFGTGKTFTLNQAVIYLMKGKANRVLLCTHTNSAADIHLNLLHDEYIHGNEVLWRAGKPLRIYSPDTELSKVTWVGRKYALVTDEVFLMPTRKNIIDHRVIITTLTTADLLTRLDVHRGFFTHILIDEAAQAWETEALIPLALAGPNTKVVFTGDHMQMNPEVYSTFAREKSLHQSLPERLFARYNESEDSTLMEQNVIFLLDNYRSNKEILDFPSRYCYEGKIKPKGHADNPSHPEMGSLSFHTAEGREERQRDNTYLNEAEVDKIVELVIKLVQSWPECWGEKNLQDIAVVAPYGSQVKGIRSKLRKQRLGSVNVETIHNVQGKEFRALFISTVRTRNCIDLSSSQDRHHEDLSLQFLSNPKLLITAVTRAKSLVAVVGDPVALCSIGRCRILWKDYISSCKKLGALCGTTWEDLIKEIREGVKNTTLNPEAPLFLPESSNSLQRDVQETSDDVDILNDDLEDNDNDPHTDEQVDEIIKAFIKNCHEREASENARKLRTKRNNSRLPDLKSLRCKWLIRRKNGREEILLLDLYDKKPVALIPEKEEQGILDPKDLIQKLEKDPERYLTARLHIGSDRFRTTYAVLQDKRKPDIKVKGSIKQAFDGDTVVIDLKPNDLAIDGKVGYFIGVLNQFADPRERQYICEVDPKNSSIMVPIDRSLPKIMNVSDKTHKKIPIYTKDERGKLDEVKMLSLQHVLNEKCLFVVEFLKWEKGFPLPLGCAVKTIPRGDSLDKSQKILLTDLCIHEKFSNDIEEIVRQSIPADHQVQSEFESQRMKVTNAFTIDPPGAKDLDDAISVDDIGDGKYKVGIHIADVSYFIQRGTDLDREARQRAVSYYAGQDGEDNIPMLPRKLSEDLLSLLPNVDRLTVSVFLILDSEGKVVGEEEILRTTTCSRCRLSYSQAQKIIDKKEHDDLQDVPNQVRLDVQRLHLLSAKRRWQRLREASFDHSNNREDTDAHELIEELMILTNHTVGVKLHGGDKGDTPFRIQDEPKVDNLNEWASRYGSFAKYSLALKPHIESEDITPDVREKIESEENTIFIKEKVWEQVLKAAASKDYKQVMRLICDPFCSPQIATAWQNLMKIQCKAQYQAGVQEPYHHSLKLRSYVHFTSPIRRYIDIEVHRLLLALIQEKGVHVRQQQEDGDEDEMTKLCQKATLANENSGKFEREFERISFASKLKEKSLTGMFVVDKIEKDAFVIQPVNQEQQQLLGNHKMITFDDLSPNSKSENSDGTPGTTLTWIFRMYLSSSPPRRSYRDFTRSKIDDSFGELQENAGTILAMIEDKYRSGVRKIEGDTWMKIINGIKKSASLLYHIKETDQLRDDDDDDDRMLKRASESQHEKLAGSKDVGSEYRFKVHKIEREIIGAIKESESAQLHVKETDHVLYDVKAGRKLKKASENAEEVGHFFQVTWKLKQYDMICLQLQSRLYRGMIRPDEQFLKVSPHFGICLEHRKDPRGCFAFHATGQINTMQVYENIQSYVRRWKPLLEMEAATGAVRQDDGYTLKSLQVSWTRSTNDPVKGQFTLTDLYCKRRQINFHRGDFTCVKISCESVETSSKSLDNAPTGIWIGHGLIEGCQLKEEHAKEKDGGIRIISLKILQMSSEFPYNLQGSMRSHSIECDLDIIYQPLPLRRMNEALTVNLKNSSDLVQQICLGRRTARVRFPLPTARNLSLAAHFETSGFQPLNEYQDEGVRKALKKNFSLIQGPPGTGKTVTGIHIAYWFAKVNIEVKTSNASEEESEPRLAPPQVLYCGPSNKSVDVVTEYLLRIPDMKDKILRVHGSLIQETEYPIPNKITNSKPNVSEDELKVPEREVKEVSLHHFIRSQSSPYAERLAEKEAMFAELKERNERVSDTEVSDYCELITEAEKWAIQRTDKQIILCTCSRSGSNTITSFCDNIHQCIIDECGMCMEPEVLVPMTSSKAEQFVLIGDHKQLQPVVMDRLAKTFGLQISMFERLSNRALMLEIQYRMHPSICKFPSDRFYKGNLQTASEIVSSRRTANVQIWPAQDQRCAFCHVQGEEKSTVISTAESGVHSKYNDEEAIKAVQVAEYLVDNHGQQITEKDVVILTPYRQQRKVIRDLLKEAGKQDILVTTIIKSQGSEWDYVILSLVRSLPEQELEPEPSLSWLGEHLGFITDDHQINVALTRAKNGLVIIGNKKLLSYNSTWEALINQYDKKGCVVEGNQWPFPD